MPKEIRASRVSSIHRSRASPYPCGSKNAKEKKLKQSVVSPGNENDFDEIRCPICMEHPHNAVLLICSSHGNGCRTYMCDSSSRQSNCLDQFRKTSQTTTLQCPLCRGKVSGFDVIEPARDYMNSKTRNCSLETCGFSGNYLELRRHARSEHPTVQPSNTDPRRQIEWARLEQEIDYQDFISATHGGYGDEIDWNQGTLLDLEVNFEEILNTFATLESEYGIGWDDDDDDPYLDMEIEMPFTFLDTPVTPTVWIEPNDYRHLGIGQDTFNSTRRSRSRSSRQSRQVSEIETLTRTRTLTQARARTHGSQSTRESHSSRETWQNQRGSMPHYSGGRDDGATSRPPPSPDNWFNHRRRGS